MMDFNTFLSKRLGVLMARFLPLAMNSTSVKGESIAWSHIRQFGVEGSTEGSHPNDLGFMRRAEIFAQVLAPLLKSEDQK
jgi:hypothetical protein